MYLLMVDVVWSCLWHQLCGRGKGDKWTFNTTIKA